jgi:hypothetical protein
MWRNGFSISFFLICGLWFVVVYFALMRDEWLWLRIGFLNGQQACLHFVSFLRFYFLIPFLFVVGVRTKYDPQTGCVMVM